MSYNYNYAYTDMLDPLTAAILTGVYIFYLAVAVLSIVARWKIYNKAGEEGWAAIVPFYSSYVLYKITWGNGWFFLLMFVPIANLVIAIMTLIKLAQIFGKGGGFACGLIFLYPIFLCILAFSDDAVFVGIDGQGAGAGFGSGGQAQGFQNPYYQTTTQQSAQNPQYYYQHTAAPQGPKFCPKCGTALEPGSKFCPSCGQAL